MTEYDFLNVDGTLNVNKTTIKLFKGVVELGLSIQYLKRLLISFLSL